MSYTHMLTHKYSEAYIHKYLPAHIYLGTYVTHSIPLKDTVMLDKYNLEVYATWDKL